MRIVLLCSLTLLWGAPLGRAQGPTYQGGSYAPGYQPIPPTVAAPYAYYPRGYAYYPTSGHGRAPVYYYDYRAAHLPYYSGYAGNGVNGQHPTVPYSVPPSAYPSLPYYYDVPPIPQAHAGAAHAGPVHAGPVLAGPGACCPPPPLDKALVPLRQPPKEKCWIAANVLAAFIRPEDLPGPLLTRGSPGDDRPAVLGQPGTTILFGDRIDLELFGGLRLDAGVFLNPENTLSLEATGFYLFPNEEKTTEASDAQGNPIIGRPAFDPFNQREIAFLTSLPGDFSGSTTIESSTELGGFEFNGRAYKCCTPHLSADCLLGFRFLYLKESLAIEDRLRPLRNNQLTFLGASVNPPDQLADEDLFQTTNRFYGMQVGGRVRWSRPWFNLDSYLKVALGATEQRLKIDGDTTLISSSGNQVAAGGILAVPPDIGLHSHSAFSVVPEFGLNVGVNATKHIRLLVGYSTLYWLNVARPGDQINRNANRGLIPGDPLFGQVPAQVRPPVKVSDSSIWVHILNAGIELHF